MPASSPSIPTINAMVATTVTGDRLSFNNSVLMAAFMLSLAVGHRHKSGQKTLVLGQPLQYPAPL